jgi:hypothetical protein
MRRPQLEHHLMLVAQVDPLRQPSFGEAPEVEVVAKPLAEKVLRVEAVLDHRRRRPLRGDPNIGIEVPPDVIAEVLLAALFLPGADHFERVVVDQGDSARSVASVRAAEVGHEDCAWSAMEGMWSRVAGLVGELFCLDGVHDLRPARVAFGVEHVRA